MCLKGQCLDCLATKAQYYSSYNYEVMTLQTYVILKLNLPLRFGKGFVGYYKKAFGGRLLLHRPSSLIVMPYIQQNHVIKIHSLYNLPSFHPVFMIESCFYNSHSDISVHLSIHPQPIDQVLCPWLLTVFFQSANRLAPTLTIGILALLI